MSYASATNILIQPQGFKKTHRYKNTKPKNIKEAVKKIKEPSWYEEDLPKSTVESKGKKPKIVGDLQFEDGKKLI